MTIIVERRTLLAGAGAAAAALPLARAIAGTVPPMPSPRRITPIDDGWRFHLGHAADPAQDFGFGASHDTYAKSGDAGTPVATPKFDDSGWATVRLPHDWANALPYERFGPPGSEADKTGSYQGFKPVGRRFPANSVGWYRRRLDIPATEAGRRLRLEFDGATRDVMVILNGFFVGRSESGYAPFSVDITDFAVPGGDNILVVRCDVSLGEAWSYEGAGLYRHVRLVSSAPTHIRQWGVAVRPEVGAGRATIRIATELVNDGPATTVTLHSAVIGPDGRRLAEVVEQQVALPAWGGRTVEQVATVADPQLWSPKTPHIHRLESAVIRDGMAVDADVTRFGVRTFRFDAKAGFFVNGKPVKIKGTCNHQDHAGVGFAVPDSLHRWRIEQLKAMGSNAYRSTHHPAPPAVLDACDELGILVLDETRQMSSNPEAIGQLERMIRRDRNRACVFLWSIGNEEVHRATATGAAIARTMKRRIYELDGTRPITEAFNGHFGEGASPVLDVMGFNYYLDGIDPFHAAHPDVPTIGTETASTVMTRGVYARDDKAQLVPAYDTDFPRWASTAERWWTLYDARPWLSGGFVWTGFDYKGEPTPYESWPSNASNFGQMDSCGFPKDNYYYYKAWWGAEPVLHLFPHWDWAGREGQPVDVWVHSNGEAVELLLNGRSLGTKTVERGRHLAWSVPYAPGRIEARSRHANGKRLVAVRETTGAPAAIRLSSDRRRLRPGKVAVVRAAIVDGKGREVPTAAKLIKFALTGPGRILGVGNGDPRSLEADEAEQRSTFNGLAMALVEAGPGGGALRLEAQASGLRSAMLPILTD
ncbi:beta-galactosidase GalA [Sphingomonas sp. XXL09]|uniref:beta-galactosidase GalA n=1 Tax=Sphingomonas sp. XXL09 TaxID=3457787 RepID=UPI00406BAC96